MIRASMAVAVFFSLSAHAAQQEAPKFFIWPPTGWEVQADPEIRFHAVSQNPGEQGTTLKVSQQFLTVGETLDIHIAAARKAAGKSWNVRRSSAYSRQGLEGKMFDIEQKFGTGKTREMKLFLADEGRVYVITCGAPVAVFPAIEAKCTTAINTFGLKP